jgi:hemerythrin-like domain-containing protein
MLRDRNLIPLSRQHQHALALCVRIERASPIEDGDLATWQAEIAQHFQTEIGIHFAAEERILFPAVRKFHDLIPLIDELLADHVVLRDFFAKADARNMSAAELLGFSQRMSAHIRREERQLFERLQELMNEDELSMLGRRLADVLKDATQACALPSVTSRPRPLK